MSDEVTLYAPNGKPIDRGKAEKSLQRSLSFPKLSEWQEAIIGGLSPADLNSIYQEAAKKEGDPSGFLTFAEELEERDGHYAGQLSVRKHAAAGVEYTFVGGEKAVADEVTNMMAPILVDALDAMLDGLGKGYGTCRPVWETFKGKWMIAGFEWVDPHWLRWKDQVPKLLTDDGKELRDIPPFALAIHQPRLKKGSPIRGGLARRCGIYHLQKATSLRDWLGLTKVYGLPIPLGYYIKDATEEEKKSLLNLVKNLKSNGGGIVPMGTKIEFQQNSSAANGQAIYGELFEQMNREISKAILGQIGTADGGQGNSRQTEMGEVRQDIKEHDAKCIALTINRQIIQPWCWLNYGRIDIAPECVPSISSVRDLYEFMRAAEIGQRIGMPMSAEALQEHVPWRPPAEGEKLLKPIKLATSGKPTRDDDNDDSNEDDDE